MKFTAQRDCENFHRRDFLHVGALSMFGLGLPSILAADETTQKRPVPEKTKIARNVIMIWLAGGPSTIDMWDLKPNAPRNIRGEFKPIKTSADTIRISEHLEKTAKVMDQCTLIRSLSHTVAEHGQGTQYVMTGNPINPALKYPSIGSVTSNQLEPTKGVPTSLT